MKNNRLTVGVLSIILGVVVALIPNVLFPVCESMDKKMSCYYTSKAEIGIGVLIAILGLIYVFIENKDIRVGITIAQVLNSTLVLLFPLAITGLCKMHTMACRVKTLPALIVVSVILIIGFGLNLFYLIRRQRP